MPPVIRTVIATFNSICCLKKGYKMSESKSVLLVGWDPDFVDYSKWPGLNAEKLLTALTNDRESLLKLGYNAEFCFIQTSETACDVVAEALAKNTFDVVLVGAGVRTVSEYFLLFEKLINAIGEKSPTSKICFNSGPTDSVEAVQRWT